MKKRRDTYHHGNLAESLLEAVDETATRFGLEAVTLRGCAKLAGVSPSSAFRHYADKRALMTAFATRALLQLSEAMVRARADADAVHEDAFLAVGLAYVRFALDKPAFFRAMWREEALYTSDERYVEAANRLGAHLRSGFVGSIDDEDPTRLGAEELLAWSSVHGLANLFVDGPVGNGESTERRLERARAMLEASAPVFARRS